MTQIEVEDLMMGSSSERQWDENCDKVKQAFGGQYPPFWYAAIIQSGLAGLIVNSWKRK